MLCTAPGLTSETTFPLGLYFTPQSDQIHHLIDIYSTTPISSCSDSKDFCEFCLFESTCAEWQDSIHTTLL